MHQTLIAVLFLLGALFVPTASADCAGYATDASCVGVATYTPGDAGYDYTCIGESTSNEYCRGVYLGPESGISSFCVGVYDSPGHRAEGNYPCGGLWGFGPDGIGACGLRGAFCVTLPP